jgi:hypothetical protein
MSLLVTCVCLLDVHCHVCLSLFLLGICTINQRFYVCVSMILQLVGSILLLTSCGSINHSLGQSRGLVSLDFFCVFFLFVCMVCVSSHVCMCVLSLMCVHSSCVDFICEKLTKNEQCQGLKIIVQNIFMKFNALQISSIISSNVAIYLFFNL